MAVFAFPAYLTEVVFPFLLVFVLVFAILRKSKLFGESNKADPLIALAVGLLAVAFPFSREFIGGIMPWLAIGLTVILVFMLLYGFIAGDLSKAPDWMKITAGILALVFLVIVVVIVSGIWGKITGAFEENSLLSSVVFILIIVGAVVFVMVGGRKS